jgi:tetratricopeptide (TPR) repeat protein
MLREGRSWSGRERNCFFLNTHDGRFANASAASGFDFPDDARAVALVDWDQDGKLDLWVSNRNAPRLRFLKNEAPSPNHFLSILLAGNGTATNADAIGARVDVYPGGEGRPISKTLRAGEGFLAQSSKCLHFGLAAANRVDKVVVRWPAGEAEEFTGLKPDRRYRLLQGTGSAREVPSRAPGIALKPSVPEALPDSSKARIPLVNLFRMPELEYQAFDGSPRSLKAGGRPVLLNLWASWCAPCLSELKRFARAKEAFKAQGVEVVALSVDGLGDDRSDAAKAAAVLAPGELPFTSGRATASLLEMLQGIHDSHLPLHRPLPIPSSFLVDSSGRLAVIYKGPVEVNEVLSDLDHARKSRLERWRRSAPLGGRAIDHENVARAATLAEARARFLFALDLAKAGRREDSLAEYKDVLELKPDFAEAQSNLGLLFFWKGDLASARDRYQRALGIRPDMAAAHYNLGALLEKGGDLPQAEAEYRETLRLKPEYAEANNALGLVCAKEGKMAEATSCFAREIALNPSFAESHNNLGIILLNRGQDAAAEARFREALRLKPEHADASNNLGVVLKRQGRLEEAGREYEKALRLNPLFVEALNNLGALLLSQGKLEEASSRFRRALEIQPDFTPARKNLERARALLGPGKDR